MDKQGPAPARDTGWEGADTEEFPFLPRRQVVLILGGALLAFFLAALDQTIVATAMPRIIADLEGFEHYTWVTTSYMMAATTVVPIVGRLSDMYGRKLFYIAGITIFLLGSTLSGLSQTMTQLIVFRGLQGVGGGAMMAITFIAIGDIFPPAERGKYQGLVAAVFGLASIIGPTLGGAVTDYLSWHWVFYINIPLGIPIIAVFIAFFPQVRPSGKRHQLDYLGVCVLLLAVVPLLLAFSWGGTQYDWDSAQILGMLAFAALMAVLLVAIERKVPDPIIPLSIFSNPIVSVSLLVVFLTGFGMFGGIIFVPLFFQAVLGSSAISSGSFLTPMMLAAVVSSVVSGQVLSRWGGHYRLLGLLGLATMGIGVFLLSQMSANTSYGQAVANIVLMGLGLGTSIPIFTIAVQNAVPYRHMGIATSSTQFFRSLGGVLGLAVLGSVMTNRFASELTSTVPQGVKDAMPPGQLSELARNPQALVNPEAQEQLRAVFSSTGPDGDGLFQQLLDALQHSLSSAISEVFLIGLVAVAIAWVATIFLKEVPLQRERRPGVQRVSTQPESRPAGDG